MNEIAIEELTKLKLEEYFNSKNKTKYYKISKFQLMEFCIDLIKVILKVEEDYEEI